MVGVVKMKFSTYLVIALCMLFIMMLHNALNSEYPPSDRSVTRKEQGQGQNVDQSDSNRALAGTFTFVREEFSNFKWKDTREAAMELHGHLIHFTGTCKNQRRFGKEGDGGYIVCMDEPYAPAKNNCLVYSFGNEWSFDDAMYDELGCEVHSFDPSMPQADHMHSRGVRFHQLGIWGNDVINDQGWNLMSLGTIIKFLGHENRVIDYLKIDVEGAEWPALQEMLETHSTRNVKQMIFEIHTPKFHATPMTLPDYAQVLNDLNALQWELGFRLYFEKHANNCCKRFAVLTTVKKNITKNRDVCCYELFYTNIQFEQAMD